MQQTHSSLYKERRCIMGTSPFSLPARLFHSQIQFSLDHFQLVQCSGTQISFKGIYTFTLTSLLTCLPFKCFHLHLILLQQQEANELNSVSHSCTPRHIHSHIFSLVLYIFPVHAHILFRFWNICLCLTAGWFVKALWPDFLLWNNQPFQTYRFSSKIFMP